MANIVNYALTASESFAERPLSHVDALCLSWLAYLRFPLDLGVHTVEGVRIEDLNATSLRSKLVGSVYDVQNSSMLVQALALSPRFRNVRVCLHLAESSEETGQQFAASCLVLPDSAGTFVAFRGTDNTLLGWKENVRFACATPLPSQERAVQYLQDVAAQVEGPLLVGGHSKGGNLAAFACGMASDEVRSRIATCFSLDGPGIHPQVRALPAWHGDVPLDKVIPRESLVGMLFERSQEGLVVVRSSNEGVMQHTPFSWEVRGNDFVCEQGMSYDYWRLSQRLNDWLEDLDDAELRDVVELLVWLMDTTAESSFSGLLARWQSNAGAMRAALDAAPAGDRELFARAMDDLATTIVLGSAREYTRVEAGTHEAANAAARKLDDLSARVNDHLSRIDRYTGR